MKEKRYIIINENAEIFTSKYLNEEILYDFEGEELDFIMSEKDKL